MAMGIPTLDIDYAKNATKRSFHTLETASTKDNFFDGHSPEYIPLNNTSFERRSFQRKYS
jgi:hypothetical protein